MHARTLRRAYTLVEMLIVIIILGLAAALVIPSMGQSGVLRVQGAIRMIVADLAVAQSDAIAFQARRAMVFKFTSDPAKYCLAEITGGAVDTSTGKVFERQIGGEQFGAAAVTSTSITGDTVYFDEMGGPVSSPTSDVPAGAQWLEVTGSGERYRINIEAYTGRITVQRM